MNTLRKQQINPTADDGYFLGKRSDLPNSAPLKHTFTNTTDYNISFLFCQVFLLFYAVFFDKILLKFE